MFMTGKIAEPEMVLAAATCWGGFDEGWTTAAGVVVIMGERVGGMVWVGIGSMDIKSAFGGGEVVVLAKTETGGRY